MIKIYNTNSVILNTKNKYCPENIEVAVDSTDIEPQNIVKGKMILGVTGTAEAGGGGGITPTGELLVDWLGTYDVTNYATVNVDIPTAEASYTPDKQGAVITSDNTLYSKVTVAPIPDEYIIPTGNFAISENGNYDITGYESVNVNVATEGGNTYWDDVMTARNGDWSYLFSGGSPADITPLIQGYNAKNVVYMFYQNQKVTTIPLFTFTGTSMASMFYNCGKVASLPDFDTSRVTNMSYVCNSAIALTTLPNWNTSKVTDLQYAFYGCQKIPEAILNTDSATSLSNIFYNCRALKKAEFSSLDKVTSTYSITEPFSGCYALRQFVLRNMTKIPVIYASGNSYGSFFRYCYHIEGTWDQTHNPEALQDGRIYVPDEWVDQMKAATHWSYYADVIYPLSQVPESLSEPTAPYISSMVTHNAKSVHEFIVDATIDSGARGYYRAQKTNAFTRFYVVNPEGSTTNTIKYRVEITMPAAGFSAPSWYAFSKLNDTSLEDLSYTESNTNVDALYYITASRDEEVVVSTDITYELEPNSEAFFEVACNENSSRYGLKFYRIYE